MKQAVLLAGLALSSAYATTGVDVSQLFSTSTYQCMKSSGVDFVIPRAWCSYGGYDKNAVQNIANARSAGIKYVDVYMFPCRGKSAADQVSQMVSSLGSSNYGQIWLDIETNPSSGCSWTGYSGTSNCQFVTDLVNAVKSHGKVPGIYSSYYMWEDIMGSAKSCTGLGSVSLWYAHYDNSKSFSDFSSFGGWSKPNIKQYKGDTTLCSAGVDMDFY